MSNDSELTILLINIDCFTKAGKISYSKEKELAFGNDLKINCEKIYRPQFIIPPFFCFDFSLNDINNLSSLISTFPKSLVSL